MTHAYGYLPDRTDPRDLPFSAPPHLLTVPLPRTLDLSPNMPPVYDQGNLGSCTGNGGAAMGEYALRAQGLPSWTPSRLALYRQARVLEDTINADCGASPRDLLKGMAHGGMAPETLWPYDVARFADDPGPAFAAEAAKHTALKYMAVQPSVMAVKTALLAGYPVGFGFIVYPGLESRTTALTGNVPMPRAGQRPLGGHFVVAVGWDDGKKKLKVRNSWGAGWGQRGYFWMPYAYFEGYASDCWALEVVG